MGKKKATHPDRLPPLRNMGACMSVGKEGALIEARRQYDADERDMRKHLKVYTAAAAPERCKQKTIIMNGKEWCPDCRRELPAFCVCRKQPSADKNQNAPNNRSRPISPERGTRQSPNNSCSRPVSPERGVRQSPSNSSGPFSPGRGAQQSPTRVPGDSHHL